MKIEPGRSVSATGGAAKPGKAAASGFAPATETLLRTAAAAPTHAATPLDSILALQAEETPAHRRARQRRRGDEALDTLEELERGLLLGRASGGLQAKLESLHGRSEMTGDPGLDAILHEIDVRLAVEAAKLERSSGKV